MPDPQPLSRRRLLRLGTAAGLSLAALGLGGCGGTGPRLVGTRGDLPAAWTSRLPKSWQVLLLEDPAAVIAATGTLPGRRAETALPPALLQLSDGWATGLPARALQPIGTTALLERLDRQAAPVARLFRSLEAPAVAFPWSLNPWVLVLRDRPDLARRGGEGWDLLLDPSLRGRLVLPASPRVCLALMEEDPGRVRQLRAQVLAHDDRDGLSLLLDGHAEAAVLPRQRVMPLLRRDPRLAVVVPPQGGPLSWNLLLSPAGAPEVPLDWLAEPLEPPLLTSLLAAGWVPPLPEAALTAALARFPAAQRALLLPPAAVRARWRDLPPLRSGERARLQAIWDGAAAPAGAG